MQAAASIDFAARLKQWRNFRRVSQLELALNASVSQRHLSWLETGKSQPSRQMVMQLAEALAVPLRERNSLLVSAGFAPIYSELPIEAEVMEPVQAALSAMLDHHEPMPAFVLNRRWHLLMANKAAHRLFAMLGKPERIWKAVDPTGQQSLARLTLHKEGLRPMIVNWSTAMPMFVNRLKREALASGIQAEREDLDELLALLDQQDLDGLNDVDTLLPVLPLVLAVGGRRLSMFSVISSFGTAQDITVDELRVEMFFPSDDETRACFQAIANNASETSLQ